MLKVKSNLYINGQLIKPNFYISSLGVVWFGGVLRCLGFFFSFQLEILILPKKNLSVLYLEAYAPFFQELLKHL